MALTLLIHSELLGECSTSLSSCAEGDSYSETYYGCSRRSATTPLELVLRGADVECDSKSKSRSVIERSRSKGRSFSSVKHGGHTLSLGFL